MENIDIIVEEEVDVNLTIDENTAYVIEVPGVSAASVLTTTGDLLGYSTLPERIPIGTDGQVLTVDTTASGKISWETLNVETDKIFEGNSSVEVVDTGIGNISFKTDTNELMTMKTMDQPITISHAASFLETNSPLVKIKTTGTDSDKGSVLWLETGRSGSSADIDVFRVDNSSGEIFSVDNAGNVYINNGQGIDEFSTDTTLAGNSDTALPTEKAVKTYVDNNVATANPSFDTVTINTNNAATQTDLMLSGNAIIGAGSSITNLTNSYFSFYLGTTDHTGGLSSGSERMKLDTNGLQLESGTSVNEFSTDTTLAGNSDDAIPTEKAVKTYVDNNGGGGFSDPMTTRGDIIYKDSSGTTTRLAAGSADQVLTSDGTDISWADASGGSSDKIEEGDSSVEVIDTGTGYISNTVDGTEIARFDSNRLYIGKDLSTKYGVPDAKIQLQTDTLYSPASEHFIHCVSSVGDCPRIYFAKARGSLSSPSAVQDDDRCMSFYSYGYDGTTFQTSAAMLTYVDGSVSTDTVPLRFVIETSETGAGSREERLVVASNGDVKPGTDANLDLGTSTMEWDNVYCVTLVESSDENKKENIEDSDLGLNFVNNLKPVKYKFKDKTITNKKVPDIDEEETIQTREIKHHRTHYGFLAQDLERAINKLGKTGEDFAGFVKDEEGNYSIRPTQLISVSIKAIQQLNQKIECLETHFNELSEFNDGLIDKTEALEQKNIELSNTVEELTKRIEKLEGK